MQIHLLHTKFFFGQKEFKIVNENYSINQNMNKRKKVCYSHLTSKGFLSGSWKNRNSSRGSARGGPIHLHRSPFLCLSRWQELWRRQGIPWKLLPGPESARRLPQRSPAPGVSQWSPKPYRLLTTGVINNPLYENVTFQEKPWVYSIINWSFFIKLIAFVKTHKK